MDFAYSGEDPAVLQLQKWGSSQVQLNLSEFYEGFISPRRELLLLLSYHCEALLLPLGKGKSVKDLQSCKNFQNRDDSFPCSQERMVPGKTELEDEYESTSLSIEMETCNTNTQAVDFTKYNCFPFISDVKSLAWGICEDLCSQHDNVPFKELLFVSGSVGVTVHAFCKSYITSELMTPVEQDDVGQGLWVEWGPSTDSAEPMGVVYDSTLQSNDSPDVSDKSWSNVTGRRVNSYSMEGQEVSSESFGVKRWFRTFLTKVETMNSDGVLYTKFPDKSSVPSSASVVSFSNFLSSPQLLEFLSDGCPTSHDKQNSNTLSEDLTHSISTDSRRLSPDALVDRMHTSYRCFKVFSNDGQCLIGFALNTKRDVLVNTTNTDDVIGCKVLVAVARLIDWGIQWICSVTVGKCPEDTPEIEWPDFKFSHAFLICLNVTGLVSFYIALTGEHVACLDSLNVCGVSPSLVSQEQKNSSLKSRESCIEEKKWGQFMNQAGDFAGRRRFKSLLVISHSLTFCVIDEYGLTYVVHLDDHIPKKYCSLEKLHPQYQQLGNGMLATWEVATAEIGYQRAFSNFSGGKKQSKSSIIRVSSFTDNTQGERIYGSYGSSLSDALDVNKNRIFGSRIRSSHSRKVFLPIDGCKDGAVCFSPFGITWLVKGKHSKGNGKCRLVHSSLHVNMTINDDSNYDIQGWDAIVDEAIGCSFHGYLYLVTKAGISVVLPCLSLPSNFYPVESIGYQQSCCTASSKYGVHKLHEFGSTKRPFSAWKVEVLDKALLYEGPEVADQLCLENGWDLNITWIRHLQLSLEYLKFEEIKKSLEMLARVNLAEEGILRLLLAALYLIFCKVGNDNEVSAASRLLALGTSFATKMIREYGLLQCKRDGMEPLKTGGMETSFHPSELIQSRPDRTGYLERLQEMASFLEIIRNLQWRLTYKCKRLGQELVDQGEALAETDLSQDESRLLDLPADVLSPGTSNQKVGLVPVSEMERNNSEDLALMPMDAFDSKNISALDTFKEPSLISRGDSLGSVFSLENPKDMIARWELDNLDVKTVVKDAILSGRLPLAVLKLHLHRSRDLMSNQDTFNEVREVGRAIAYDLFLKGETGLGVATLQRLGEDIESSLKQLVFGTVRRSLRMQIVEVMKGLAYLGPREWKILEKISLIERVYPCSSFWSTFSGRHKGFKGVSSENAPEEIKLRLLAPLGRDLIIACGELDGVVLASWLNANELPIAPEDDHDSTHSSYWSAAAVWFDVWDQRVVDCIVLDQPFLMGVNVLWESQLDYHIRHNDWLGVSGLLEVIPSYGLTSGSLSVSLDGVPSSSVDDLQKPIDCSSYIYSLEEVDAVCMNVPSVQIFRFFPHSMCSMWMLMLMEQELAKKFIFLKDYWGSTADIVALLAQSGFTRDVHKSPPMSELAESWSDSALAISDARTHPGSIQALHKVVVHYCSQHSLLNFLDLYLDHHKLALDHESVSWMQDAAGDNQWAKWLLLQRIKGKEYEASFSNARAVVSRNLDAGNSFSIMEIEDIIHTVDDIAEGAGEMAALATLMYAPIRIQDCLSSGSVNRLYSSAQCTLENLRPFLQRFPTLWRALTAACFGQDPTFNSIGPKPKLFGYSDLLDYLNWRESVFFSSAHDTSLSQMLPCWFSKAVRRLIQLYVQGPFGWQSIADLPVGDPFLLRDIVPSDISPLSWEVAIQKHIEEELYDSSLKESKVGIEHHLHRGRALAAFNHLLSTRVQKLRSESSHRGQHGTPVQGQTNIQSDVQMLLSPITQSEQLFLSSVLPLAIVHFADSVLVASCTFLLELCGLPPGALQIDVAALRRIASFNKSGPCSNHLKQLSPRGSAFHSATYDNDIAESLARGLADDYCQNDCFNQANQKSDQLTTSGKQPSRALMLVLQHLETASFPPSIDGVTCGSWLLTGNGDGVELRSQQKAASEHWNLVTTFCQAHQIPLSTRYLAILARDNDWVGFLSEAQIGGYPLETVMLVASKEFSDARLRTHILTVLKSMQSRKKFSSSRLYIGEKTSFPDENVYAPAELFGIIAECERQAKPGEALLLQAKNLCWSLLAAIASCFPDVSPLSCLTVWLEITAARETSAIKVNNAASEIANNVAVAVEATNSLPASSKAPTVHYNRKNPKRRRLMEPLSVHSLAFATPDVQKVDGNVTIPDMIVEDECEKLADQDEKVSNDSDEVAGSLSRMVAVLCEQYLFLPLLRAFEMFLPSCSLLPFIRALQAFSQMRLSEASAHLGSFSARIKEEPHVFTQAGKEGKIGCLWISSTAVKAADAMLSRCPSPYEKRCLLHLLAATDFGDGGSAAIYYQRLYWKINLAEPSLRKSDGLHLGDEPLDDASLLTALEKHGHWEQARNWAKHLEASGGSWKSVTHHVTETQAESMVAEWNEFLWDVPEERVALWSHCQTLFLRYSFPPSQAGLFFLRHAEAAEKDLPARELHELFLLSLQWLSGMITQCSPVCPMHLLREIETRAWLLAVESETQVKSEGEFTLSSREPACGKGSNIIDRTASVISKMDSHINSVRIKSGERNDIRESNQSQKTTQMSDASSSGAVLGSAKVKRRAKGFVPSRKTLADPVDRSNEPEAGSTAVNLKDDSQLPDENLKIEATFLNWEERVGPAELDRAVLSLLEFGQIAASRQLQFKLSPGCVPSEFKLVDAALKLAAISTPNNAVSILVLDGELRSVMQSYNLFPNQHVIDPLQVLESSALLLTEGRGRGLCRRIISVVKAANVLGLPFSEAFEKHPIELLQLLSLKAQDSFEEAKLLVQTHYMPAASIAQILAESFLKGLLAAHRGGYMESQKEEGPAPLLWRFSDFLKWAELCPSEPEIGHALLRLVATCQGIPHACEVELLILSHHFYKSSACLDGVDVLVDLAFKKVEAYVSEGDFPCLARLITGVRNFHALNFILGILIENGQLDLLLQKFSAAVDANAGTAEAVRGFRMAVLTLLKQFNPNDLDAFAMVYSHFDMKHETASLLESRAEVSCKEWSLRSDKDQTDDLLASMRYFIEAAEVYSSIDAGNKTRQACAQASLFSLQIRMPDLHFIYLSETNARRALVEQSRFQEALIVAEAYGLNQPGEWALVLWNQMLRPELIEQFVAEFVAVLPLQPSMLLELARFYRAEVAARGDQSQFSVWLTGGGLPAEWAKYLGRSFRCLLRRTRDLRLRYQLATIATGFIDVVDACNRAFDKIPENAGPLVLRKGHGGGYLPLM